MCGSFTYIEPTVSVRRAMALSASQVQEELQQPAERQLRNQLAAAARSINWTYALFWSISSTQPRVLTWTDGFYNGEVETRKISNSVELTADQLVLQRSEQLRELYEALLSGECDRRAALARPVGSLSPQDLGDTEWYYVICMTYAFRPGQGLPGRSFASNEHVWLCNAHLTGSKAFPRALLAKSASIQSIVCIPLMGGVLELGTTDTVPEDPDLVSRATAAFLEPQCPVYLQEPSSNPSANEAGEAADIVVFEDLGHNAMETMTAAGNEPVSLFNASLEHITKEIDFYSLCEEMDVRPLPLEDSFIIVDGSNFEVPSSPQPPPPGATTNNAADTSSALVDGSRATSFMAWTRSSQSCSDEAVAVPVIEEPQKLLKKVMAGGGATRTNCGGGGGTTVTAQEISGIKNHVMSEPKRREKLNDMFLILKSLVPSIQKVDKVSILAETIAYLKELQRRVQELESKRPTTTRPRGIGNESVRKKLSAGSKRKSPEFGGDVEKEHPWVFPKDGTSNVTVTVSDRDVLLEVQCRWEELLMTRVFDAIKSLHLDVHSVQASAPDGFMGLKIRAQFVGSGAVVPGMISEALRKAIGNR
ncbi:anthocyanin regulatory R-S protein-like [Miscanthus floridulus]|uniref:anthocyanin regulatory R-S protein-like n=1 Tax=Miscanthus floridulus TaxID=154761 RepID=UPI00345A62EC